MSAVTGMSFPVTVSLRVIGRNQADFSVVLVELVRRHASEVDEGTLTVRPSRDGNYVSVVIPMRLENKAQMDAVYRELNAHESVIMVL